MGNRDMPRRCRSGHGEDLKPVPQQQHGVRAVGGKVVVENFHRACDGFGDRFIGVVSEDRQSCRDGQAVSFDFMHGLAQTRAAMRPGHDELQVQHIGRRDFLHHRAQQAIFRPRGGNDGDGTHGVLLCQAGNGSLPGTCSFFWQQKKEPKKTAAVSTQRTRDQGAARPLDSQSGGRRVRGLRERSITVRA